METTDRYDAQMLILFAYSAVLLSFGLFVGGVMNKQAGIETEVDFNARRIEYANENIRKGDYQWKKLLDRVEKLEKAGK